MDYCPRCKVSLLGEAIPEDLRENYSPPYFWKREIGLEYKDIYDGIWEWQCPDCKTTWPSEAQRRKNGRPNRKSKR